MLIFILIVIFLFAIYAAAENILFLTVRRERLGSGIKIVQISDLHKRRFGKGNSRICDKVKAEKPDLIFITGDLVSRTETDLSNVRIMLSSLCSIAPVYIIFGNHEQSLSQEMQREFISMVASTDAILLRNSSADITVNGRLLHIFGLEQKYTTYKKGSSYRGLDGFTHDEMTALLGTRPDGEVLLLAHNPFFAGTYAQWGADCVFSGHVHGGAVRLFGIGILSPERRFFPKYTKGVYTLGKTKMVVSSGLGKLRLFNPPELVVCSL